MKRTLMLLSTMVVAILLAGGVALSATTTTFENSSNITINFHGSSPYPSQIQVSGVRTTGIEDVNLMLRNFSYFFIPDDACALVVGPQGQSTLVLSDVGDGATFTNIDLTFDDEAANVLPDSSRITAGTYKPTQGTSAPAFGPPCPANFPSPAPAGPYGTQLSVFDGTDPNGTWSLYVINNVSESTSGQIANGWSLEITAADPPPDTQAPKVLSTFPRGGGEVGPAASIRATFSEDMLPASVINAFKLFRKGSTNQIAATVTYDAATDTATLNPTDNLRRGVTYKAVVSTQAKDEEGNRLDQNSSKAGLQQKVWFFEIDN
jgi:large repetitive protein